MKRPSSPRWWQGLRQHAALIAALLVVAMGYWFTAARHVLGHDNGEYLTVGAEGGVPHPPGYPLYVLWLRVWSWLPAQSGAHAASLATVMLGLLAAVVL